MEIKAKTVVFCDEGQEDWENYFLTRFNENNIYFINLNVFDTPQAFEESFEIFMFDWGGMSLGNSMLEHFIRRLYKLAEENPNKDFILLSRFTKDAYEDMLDKSHSNLENIYTIYSYILKLNGK